ncbi:Uu.00g056360.m01.CDS01 [Anthostomella pinea]|uniref:Uu.00g056360.m01.CDS01 n=1 Tax=Anthostomella pinea TaxID=933095 RepID=A0AAI8YJN4_9PEZI|nr:Uu.00g056360.m01.CDS01 [Anthostomella pinea]
MTAATLNAPQLQALLDILLHHETYAEVQSFKEADAIDHYGFPFVDKATKEKSSSPLLQLLLTRTVLSIPGIKDVSPEFWNVKFKGIMRRFGEAELSDSYDKGTLGSRKRLATAASVVHEAVTRGLLSGVSNDRQSDLQHHYDTKKAEDLTRAWQDSVRQLVYGNLIDELFDQFTKSEDFEGHSPAIKAAVEYVIFYLAAFLHSVFVLSAEGPYLLKLLDNVHKLIPYTMIGQTLRVGNAGTMINGLVRLFLAKVSVGSITNWIGLTSNASDGMNLMQRIISMVLGWDASEFRKAADNIKHGKDGVSDEHLAAIDQHLQAPRKQHEAVRQRSMQENKSIIVAILESQGQDGAENLTDVQHTLCLEYYSAQLAIRDREKIIEVLCTQTPDLTTSIVRDGVAVYEPMIRTIHKHVDLRKHVGAFESFLTDLIKTSKPKPDNGQDQNTMSPPSVEDLVRLFQRNRHLAYAYLHDFATGCPDLRDTWKAWAKEAVKVFRRKSEAGGDEKDEATNKAAAMDSEKASTGAGDMDPELQKMFRGLPEDRRKSVQDTLDAHFAYLSAIEGVSRERIQRIISSTSNETKPTGGGMTGPGIYASRWQSLLDETMITPGKPHGPPRRGEDVKSQKALGKTEAVANSDTWDPDAVAQHEEKGRLTAPDPSMVIDAFAAQFKALIADLSSSELPQS